MSHYLIFPMIFLYMRLEVSSHSNATSEIHLRKSGRYSLGNKLNKIRAFIDANLDTSTGTEIISPLFGP